ncbi:MAG TPA: tetratricopeptide repeat protein [Bryobacteraceae bacterium]|jgi:tetratricopeptide (TPR) repeat protein|nr:tetratricopeptide repeat protein [Bryobacteraceae bacterium]
MKKVFSAMTLLAMGTVLLPAQQNPPSPDEVKALQAIVNATTVDARVAASDTFVKSFPKSEYRSFALTMAAEAYEMGGNVTKAIIYYQQALEANPKDYNAMLMLAAETARTTREFDLDKEEKLTKAEKYANDGMKLIPTAAKPNPQITDQQWADLKKDDLARGHEALGLIAVARKKYDDAAGEFKTATETASQVQPATFIRMAGAYTDAGKPDQAIAALDKALAMPNIPDQIKQVAQAEKARAEKAKTAK